MLSSNNSTELSKEKEAILPQLVFLDALEQPMKENPYALSQTDLQLVYVTEFWESTFWATFSKCRL